MLRRVCRFAVLLPFAALISTAAETRAGGENEEIEFVGYFESEPETRFSLVRVEKDARRPSPWLKLNDMFGEVTIARFDRSAEVLFIRGPNGSERPLPLRKGTLVKGGGDVLAGKATIVFEGRKQTIDLAAKLHEAFEIPLGSNAHGKVGLAIYASRLEGSKLKVEFSTVEYRNDQIVEGTSLPTVVVLEGKPFGIRSRELEFQFQP